MLTRRSLFAYGAMALPLAMAALPVYVIVPGFYGDQLGLPLAILGVALLATRLIDTVQDPLLGYWSDRVGNGRIRFTALGVPILAFGFTLLFTPPVTVSGAGLTVWLILSLVLAYTGYSMCTISYQTWGAELTFLSHERSRVTAIREGFSLVGVLLAAVLPPVLMLRYDTTAAMTRFVGIFLVLLAIGASITIWRAPRPVIQRSVPGNPWLSWKRVMANREFLHLCGIFLLNGMAAAIPATLVVFYVEYVLQASQYTGLFLALYFLAGISGMPVWVKLAVWWDKRRSWLLAMGLAIAAFGWAAFLGSGDSMAFAIICLITGFSLGADLALPPAMLADMLARKSSGTNDNGSHFGLWNLLAKLSLALSAGISLPLLQWVGFRPGDSASGIGMLAIVYALLPCVLKCCAATSLMYWRQEVSCEDALC